MKIIKNTLLTISSAIFVFTGGLIFRVFSLIKRRPIGRFYRERAGQSDYIPIQGMPDSLLHFVLQIEDSDFYQHPGFSISSIRDALMINLRTGSIQSGGSSITQQVAKNLYFEFYHSYLRKLQEFIIAFYIEQTLTKDQILELYLNIVYFGNGIYGIVHAARFYFDKEVRDLSINQMFLLAALLYAPTKSNPILYPEVFERIRNKRVQLLQKRGTISEEDADLIVGFHADCLDPELRTKDEFIENYPQDVTMVNDRFGLKGRRERVTIP